MAETIHGFTLQEMKHMAAKSGMKHARTGPMKGVRIDRWLYTEPYFRVQYVSERPSPLVGLRGQYLRGPRDMLRLVEAAAEGGSGLCCIEVRLSASALETCPRSLVYWLEDLVSASQRVARARAGGVSEVTFVHKVMSMRLPFICVGLSVGKRCQAAEIVSEEPWWPDPVAPSPQPLSRAGGAKKKRVTKQVKKKK